MSDFEFMRNMPFGPYIPVYSPLNRLDPRTRILLAVMLMIGLLAAPRFTGLLLGLAAVLVAWWISKVPFEPLRRGWTAALPFLVFLALIQVVFRTRQGEIALITLGALDITWGDLGAGLALLLRFSGFIALLGLTSASLSEAEVTHGLEALLRPLTAIGIPAHDFVLAVQVSMRYFPLLAQSAERIAKAQASRGADWSPAGWNIFQRVRQLAPLVIPLFVTSLRRAESMALAMDARGYGSLPVRTSMVEMRFTGLDAAALVFGVVLVVVMLLV